MQTETIISLAIAFAALLFTALSFRRTSNHDTQDTATAQATLAADVRYIRTSVDEIKVENRAIRSDLDRLNVKVAAIEQSAKSAHRRIDDMIKN